MRIFYLLCISFVLATATAAQQPYSFNLQEQYKFSENEIFDLLQDEDEFIWLGTNSGLYRFDGTEFIAYKQPNERGKAISHLTLDKNKKIWCQNFQGQLFSIDNERLVERLDGSKQHRNYPIFTFDNENTLWVTTDKGLWNSKTQHEIITNQKPESAIIDLLAHHDKIYFSNKHSIGYIHEQKTHYITACNQPNQLGDIFEFVHFFETKSGVAFISQWKNKYTIWTIQNDSIRYEKEIPARFKRIFSIQNTADGNVWICSSDGATCLKDDFSEAFDGQVFFPEEAISDVLLDKEGNYWFSSLQDGIFIIPNIRIRVYTAKNSIIADTRIRQIEKDKLGNLYLGYQSGMVSKYQIAENKITHYEFPNSPSEIQAMYLDTLTSELLVGQGKAWRISTTHFKKASQIPNISYVKTIQKKDSEKYIMGNVLSACYVNCKTNQIEDIRKKRTTHIVYDSLNQTVWMNASDGVWVKEANAKSRQIKHRGIPVYANDIIQSSDGIIWLASDKYGLVGIKNNQLIHQQSGFGSIRKLAYNHSDIWIVNEKNIIKYNYKTGKKNYFNLYDGINSVEISDIEFLDEKIFLATPKGLVSFSYDLDAINTKAPVIRLVSFFVHEKPVLLDNAYKLPYQDNNIRIDFKGIAYRSQGTFYYKYRLIGLQEEWITSNSQTNFVRYASLPAGEYTFQVKAVNEDGIESEEPASIQLVILKPFWQEWWFYILCAMLLVGVVSLVFGWRIQLIRKRNELEKKWLHSKMTALKSQMNPHFMYNALNSIQALILKQDIKNSNLYLSKFSHLMRKVLHASDAEKIRLQEEIEILQLYLDLERLRFSEELNYTIDVDAELDPDNTFIPPMIIQPFVENALKHGLLHKKGAKNLSISFIYNNGMECHIQDNGVGRKKSGEINAKLNKVNPSFASQATETRIELLHAYTQQAYRITITDLFDAGKASGTLVILHIPL